MRKQAIILFLIIIVLEFITNTKAYSQIPVIVERVRETPERTRDQVQRIMAYTPSLPITNPVSKAIVDNLARYAGLFEETQNNPHLSFLPGDISYWYNAKRSLNRLKLEFAARKIVLEAADEVGAIINTQGDLSSAAQQIMAEVLKARAVLEQQTQ